MIASFKTSALITILFAAFMTVVLLATPSHAGAQGNAEAIQSRVAASPVTLAANFKAPGGESRKKCNGKTTSECCKGLSKCSCLYMPGSSSDNHPTACFATKKSSSRNRS